MSGMIDSFTGKYRFLSNFHASPFEATEVVPGLLVLCPTVEHAYQAMKTNDLTQRMHILNLSTAAETKKAGRRLKIRDDWDSVKLAVMEYLVREKFRQNPILAKALLATGDAELIEGNYWGDVFWGVCRGVGRNELGRILMRVREELRGPSV